MNMDLGKYARPKTDWLNPDGIGQILPRLQHDYADIKRLREAMDSLGVNSRFAALKRKQNAHVMGRRIAKIPPPIYFALVVNYPDILANPKLLKQFLRDSGLLLVDKSRL